MVGGAGWWWWFTQLVAEDKPLWATGSVDGIVPHWLEGAERKSSQVRRGELICTGEGIERPFWNGGAQAPGLIAGILCEPEDGNGTSHLETPWQQ